MEAQSPKSIEEMTLESLEKNVMDLSEEELQAFILGTRNNRNTAPPTKTRKKAAKKKKETGVDPELANMLAQLEAAGISLEDLLGDG